MNMLLHHQKRRNLGGGTFVNIGEDGCPYADNELLIVADGLGGRGGYPHTKINPEIFDSEMLWKKILAPVIGDANDDYSRFVINSFSELFGLKDKYYSNTANMRTSGYFASRLVTAIALYELKLNPQLNKATIFNEIAQLDGDMRQQYISSLGDHLSQVILAKLSEIAKRMGLELESKTKGSYLLPTTLTIALVNETESGVDVLYLWAGDSRGYLWDADGLAQITDDHERDETMTNLITLTKPFKLEARLLSGNSKPLILFNATDGCYKCPCFASPFDLEYVLLQAIAESKDFGGVRNILDQQFTAIGTHDDSNTMALSTYGFDSFDAIKAAVVQRTNYLHENIVQKLPGILERDFDEELSRIDEQMEGGIYSVREDLIDVESVAQFVSQRMMDAKYPPYMCELQKLHGEYEKIKQAITIQQNNIHSWVQYYWLRKPCLKRYSKASMRIPSADFYRRISAIEEICSEEKNLYIATYGKILEDLSGSNFSIMRMRDGILSLSVISDKETMSYLSDSLSQSMDALSKIDSGIVKGRNKKTYARYYESNSTLDKLTKQYVATDQPSILHFTNEIINGNFLLNGMEMPNECRAAIEGFLDALHMNIEVTKEIVDEIAGLKNKYFMGYWTENLAELISIIQKEHPELIPEAMRSRIVANVGDLQSKRDEIAHCIEIRAQLYGIYAESYYRHFEESTL